MTSNKPYLLRAFYEWIMDNHLTPYILVDATKDYVDVPQAFVKDGQIVFDLSPDVLNKLLLNNDRVEFDARFSGQVKHVYIPMNAVLAIYAHENGEGIVFDPNDEGDDAPPETNDTASEKSEDEKKPKLRIVD